MPDKLIEWKSASLRSGVSSFGFSGTNGHGIMEATASTEPKELRKPAKFARKARLCGSALSRFFSLHKGFRSVVLMVSRFLGVRKGSLLYICRCFDIAALG